ncbi:MAG: hypothetical protein LUG93_03765 [Lachnospiraceae bacterium]|nr:hypothetical protein [Lachnospiraceae bacterium]
MTRISAEKKVYCYTLEGSRYLFADERVKMHLIDLISEIHRRDGWLLFTFCILDDSASFIIGADKISAVVRTLQTTVRRHLWQPPEFRQVRESRMELSGQVEKLSTMAEIIFRSREIHRLPLEQGYVYALEDYWWSSYPTYTGLHIWEMVDRRVLSMAFSPDPIIARRQLERFNTADSVRTYEMNEILICK